MAMEAMAMEMLRWWVVYTVLREQRVMVVVYQSDQMWASFWPIIRGLFLLSADCWEGMAWPTGLLGPPTKTDLVARPELFLFIFLSFSVDIVTTRES